ncbi:uncharacterized protein EV154DRAFT_498070, partial [Mucor mucedo]|uniref:uncharacterized protein n=1 Tax=Mucor mucedo TaxID=29922 RepID=UPI002220C32C
SIKLKSIFRPQIDAYSGHAPSTLNRKAAAHLQISPPILQHSTSIYSLVSPTRTAFTSIYSNDKSNDIPYELYQPLSPPPPIPQQRSPWSSTPPNSLSPAPQRRTMMPVRREFERPMHPLDLVPDRTQERNLNRSRNAEARRTVATDPREQISEDYVMAVTSNTGRRHSCSSTVIYKQQQQQSTISIKPPKNELTHGKSLRTKIKERRRSSKVGSSFSASSAAATFASLEQPCMEASKSTPLRKIKTYNVPKKNVAVDVEKERKMQELEDLITGRRGSTLKLTLTPKGLT